MAEPANTPIPASTPRSTSPVHGASHPLSPTQAAALNLSGLNIQKPQRQRLLLLGGPDFHDEELFANLKKRYDVIQPGVEDRQRDAFVSALKEGIWGDFRGILRPAWGTGGEMGNWDTEIIEALPKSVKVFAGAGAGFDWVDVKALGERGIIYCNSGLAAAAAVGDFTVAMIISTFRHLPWGHGAAFQPDTFSSCHKDAIATSYILKGKKLGIIGFGNIGQEVAQRCYFGFGMKISFFDIESKDPEVVNRFEAQRADSLEELLGDSDCTVLCRPGGEKLITTETVQHFKRGSRFVNVARGSLVDEEAVAQALESGRLSSVALDVFENEPTVSEGLKKFASAEGGFRAMLSCHNAGGTMETHRGFETLCVENVEAVLEGRGPRTPVNLQFLKK